MEILFISRMTIWSVFQNPVTNIDCVSERSCKSGSKLWQLSTWSVMAFLKYIQVLTSAENSLTGRAYIGEVLIQTEIHQLRNK